MHRSPLAAGRPHNLSHPWTHAEDSGRRDVNTLLDDVAVMLAEIAGGNLVSPLSGSPLVPGAYAIAPSKDGGSGQAPRVQERPDGAAQNSDVASRTPQDPYRIDWTAATTAVRHTRGLLRIAPLGVDQSTLSDEALLHWQEMGDDGMALSALDAKNLLYGSTDTSSQRPAASPPTDASKSPESPSSSPADPGGGQATAEPMSAGDG